MKYDFSNISFLVHLRVDIPERFRNLQLVMRYYHTVADNVEFIIVNDDSKPYPGLKELKDEFKNSKFIHVKNDDIYMRPFSFNQAFKLTNRRVIIAGDTDVIVDSKFIDGGAKIILSGSYNHVYPYNGLFCWVKKDLIDKFSQTMSLDIFEQHKPLPENLVPNYENENVLVAHTSSKGGCIMYSRDIFEVIGGYNPLFKGWGYEDDEINHRLMMLGGKTLRISDNNAIAWHLEHPNTVRDKHPYYDNNFKLLNYTRSLNKKQLINYIRTWNR